jgi:DNA-binding MarR family transcriptional regulator
MTSPMTAKATVLPGPLTWDSYRNNVSQHLLGVSRHMQTCMMRMLQDECGHTDLRLGFAPYITLIGDHGIRLSELADAIGISRQACNQAVNQIQAAGYVGREADPDDGRARLLVLTERGRQLRRDGVRVVRQLDTRFAAIAGNEAVDTSAETLGRLYTHLSLGLGDTGGAPFLYGGLGGLLPRLSDYMLKRLMELTVERGHRGLKLSFGQVLVLMGPEGGRIQHMAAMQDVSKQAISAIATELEQLGYLRREQDPRDARQVVLYFTPDGERLIADSVSSVEALAAEFSAVVGKAAMRQLSATLRALHQGLGLENETMAAEPDNLAQLATQLRQRLGDDASRELARLLVQSPVATDTTPVTDRTT